MDISAKKIIFIDMDGTLINTRSGATFPKGTWDMTLNMDVFERLRDLHPLAILINTNQGGIELGIVNPVFFECKLRFVLASLQEFVGQYTQVAARYCPANAKEDPMRKPNPGMLNTLVSEFATQLGRDIDNKECIMIGDASGLPGDHSDSDLQAARNFGCEYLDVNEFIKMEIPEPKYRLVFMENGKDFPECNNPGTLYTKEEVEKEISKQKEKGIKLCAVPEKWELPNIVEERRSAVAEQQPQKGKKVIMKPKTRKR